MVKSFVLLTLNVISAEDKNQFRKEIAKINGIKEIYSTFGVYDFVVIIEKPEFKKIYDEVIHKLRSHRHVRNTQTIPITDETQ